MPPDHYSVLGIPPNATADEVKAAYRRLAHENHPDFASSEEERRRRTEKMKFLNDIYNELRDPAKRKAYDERLARGAAGGASSSSSSSSSGATGMTRERALRRAVDLAFAFNLDQSKGHLVDEIEKLVTTYGLTQEELTKGLDRKAEELREAKRKEQARKAREAQAARAAASSGTQQATVTSTTSARTFSSRKIANLITVAILLISACLVFLDRKMQKDRQELLNDPQKLEEKLVEDGQGEKEKLAKGPVNKIIRDSLAKFLKNGDEDEPLSTLLVAMDIDPSAAGKIMDGMEPAQIFAETAHGKILRGRLYAKNPSAFIDKSLPYIAEQMKEEDEVPTSIQWLEKFVAEHPEAAPKILGALSLENLRRNETGSLRKSLYAADAKAYMKVMFDPFLQDLCAGKELVQASYWIAQFVKDDPSIATLILNEVPAINLLDLKTDQALRGILSGAEPQLYVQKVFPSLLLLMEEEDKADYCQEWLEAFHARAPDAFEKAVWENREKAIPIFIKAFNGKDEKIEIARRVLTTFASKSTEAAEQILKETTGARLAKKSSEELARTLYQENPKAFSDKMARVFSDKLGERKEQYYASAWIIEMVSDDRALVAPILERIGVENVQEEDLKPLITELYRRASDQDRDDLEGLLLSKFVMGDRRARAVESLLGLIALDESRVPGIISRIYKENLNYRDSEVLGETLYKKAPKAFVQHIGPKFIEFFNRGENTKYAASWLVRAIKDGHKDAVEVLNNINIEKSMLNDAKELEQLLWEQCPKEIADKQQLYCFGLLNERRQVQYASSVLAKIIEKYPVRATFIRKSVGQETFERYNLQTEALRNALEEAENSLSRPAQNGTRMTSLNDASPR